MSKDPNKKVKVPHNGPKEEETKTNKCLIIEDRVDRIEAVLGKLAHFYGGGGPRVLREFGLDVYEPTKDDMKKFKG